MEPRVAGAFQRSFRRPSLEELDVERSGRWWARSGGRISEEDFT